MKTPSFLSLARCLPLAQGQNSLHAEWAPLLRAVPWPLVPGTYHAQDTFAGGTVAPCFM